MVLVSTDEQVLILYLGFSSAAEPGTLLPPVVAASPGTRPPVAEPGVESNIGR